MFSCVWLHFKKIFEKYFLVFGKEEGKDKTQKNTYNPKRTGAIGGGEAPFARSRDLAIDSARITLREIAIDANGAS